VLSVSGVYGCNFRVLDILCRKTGLSFLSYKFQGEKFLAYKFQGEKFLILEFSMLKNRFYQYLLIFVAL
jgi:hypothetical protein